MRKFHQMKFYTTLLLLWFAGVFLPSSSFAEDLITARSYWEDKSGNVSLEQATSHPFLPYAGVLSRGYTQSAIWIRLELTPPAGAQPEDKLVLRLLPTYLDEIALFDPLDTSGTQRKVGDTSDYKDAEFQSLVYTFVVPAGDKPRALWLRLKTNSTCLISVEALTQSELVNKEFSSLLINVLVLAIVAMFMLLVLFNWFNYREPLYAFFVVRQAFYFIYVVSLFGFHRLLLHNVLEPKTLDALYSWIVIGATAITFGFEWKFINEYSPPKWVKAILAGMLVWSVCAFGLMLSGHTFQALRLNMGLNQVGVLAMLIMSSIFIDDEKSKVSQVASLLRKKMVVGYYLTINLVLMFSLLPYMGFLPGNAFAVNGLVFYILSSSLIMTVLMQMRANKLRQAHAGYEQTLLLSQQQVALEKNRRDEQTHLFHMLMHELKNPLAIIDMALLAKNDLQKTSSYVSRAVNNMKNILERCVRADTLAEGKIEIRHQQIIVKEFIHQLLFEQNYDADRVNVIVQGAALQIRSDAQYLQIMISNLLDNALRYGDELAPVEIFAAAGKKGVTIVVSNRPGAAAWPDADKVFKKYYRSAGAEAQSGTGLGLYLVRTLANLLGGECRYKPDDKNITFELWLPN